MSSPAFDRFVSSFLDDSSDSAREGLDTDALAALEGEERQRAEDILIERLPDVRAATGLGVLRSRRAMPELVRHFEEQRPTLSWKLIALAQALWRIEPDPRWVEAEVDALERAASEERRQGAAEALRDFRDPVAVRALIRALDAPERLIRYHAARGLLMIHGLPADSEVPQHPLYRVMSTDRAKQKAAKAEILASIARRPLAAT